MTEAADGAPRHGTWSVYVHFPWCLKRCAYCDFATSVARQIPREDYCAAILAELTLRTAHLQPAPIATVFFGGGTPSLWGAPFVGRVLQWLDNWAGLQRAAEVTLEANPGAAEAGDLRAYAAAGVNRLSVGIQALDDDRLRALDRLHDAAQARATLATVTALLGAGHLNSCSADLIFGVPGQSLADTQADIDAVLAYGVPHLSAYALTVEPGTPLARAVAQGQTRAPDDDLQADMLDSLPALVAPHGLQRYEISNYARPGHQCRHNLAYWQGHHYLAVGVGAHGFVPHAGQCGLRYANTRNSQNYLKKLSAGLLATDFSESIGTAQHRTELLLTGLRLDCGMDLRAFDRAIGPGAADSVLQRARELGMLDDLLLCDGNNLRVDRRRVNRLDSLIVALA